MSVSKGNCFICGETAGKTAIKNHILKEHNGGKEMCYLIKAEGAYAKNYWLFFTVSLDASLSAVDKFLRDIWCECCGHMSAFRAGRRGLGKSRKISQLAVGDAFLYEYDFGSTTEIAIKILAEFERPKQKEAIQLLARNVPAEEKCNGCGAPAIYVDAFKGEFSCDKCAENAEEEAMLMPIVNSPRCSECGYSGELDRWTFDPNKPFPQPQKQST